jgi:hypothetical protein
MGSSYFVHTSQNTGTVTVPRKRMLSELLQENLMGRDLFGTYLYMEGNIKMDLREIRYGGMN